jgi:glucan-binding YG repeat protein
VLGGRICLTGGKEIMKLKKLVLLSGLVLGMTCMATGCGSKGETVESVADTEVDSGDDYVDSGVDEEESSEDENKQQMKVVLNVKAQEAKESVELPISEFEKYGKVVKTKDGFRILTREGVYVSDSLLNYNGMCFYFDEDGYLKDDVFVPAKNADGSVKTLYVHNYTYVYGLITDTDGKTYYIDEDLGRLTETTKEVDGKMYYFDTNGKSISESKWTSLYGNQIEEEPEVLEDGSEVEEGLDEGSEEVSEETSEEISETESSVAE